MSGLFQQIMHELGIKQYVSNDNYPESQGALQRFHQSLKSMMKRFCHQYHKNWDEGVHLVLFAARESVQDSLGFTPFKLVFGHTVRGPLKVVKEKWLSEATKDPLLEYVSKFKEKLSSAFKIAQKNLVASQNKMKTTYDANTEVRNFKPGDRVMMFLPIPNQPLRAKFFGPYVIEKK